MPPKTMPGTPGPGREDESVDLDLDADDPQLREAIGKPVTVRIGGRVIEIPLMPLWPHEAQRYASAGLYNAWADGVLSKADAEHFKGLTLRNYQVDALMRKVTAAAGTDPGK